MAAACRTREEPNVPPQPATAPTAGAKPVEVRRPDRVNPKIGCLTTGCHADLGERTHVHGPLAVGNCDACHGPEQEGHHFPLKRAGDAVCRLCHAVPVGKPFVHAALTNSGCRSCHDPHGSDAKFLLTSVSVEAVCRTCHPTPVEGSNRHGPYAAGACTICHLPHEADNQELTIQSGVKHCTRCHTDMGERIESARFVHGPAVQGCTNCHEPHASGFENLLRTDPAAHCASCHADVDEQARTATARHGAVFTGKRCQNCHDPHASPEPGLLRAPMVEVCLGCHDQPQTAYDGRAIPEMRTKLTTSTFLHGPIRHGECQACHQVHGSSNERLLKQYFPGSFYRDFDLTNYALCFSCHEKALVLDQETTTLTGFRNGSRNLHYLHVNRLEKGRTCKACHEIHGSEQPAHIARTVPFEGGGWAMPINFRKTPSGGGCGPGCHQAYDYDRDIPVTYPTRP